jgi:hypothetical protein
LQTDHEGVEKKQALFTGPPQRGHPFTGHSVCRTDLAPGPLLDRGSVMTGNNGDFVPIEGVVRLVTSLGIFLDADRRRIVVPETCFEMPELPLQLDRGVTLQVLRWYAKQEGLVA